MKKKTIIFAILIIAFTINLKAHINSPEQTDAHIFGHVLDKRTKEHLPYVTIKLQGTTVV